MTLRYTVIANISSAKYLGVVNNGGYGSFVSQD